ncbi:hypothetical protein O181_122491 [Austropuccinia psidii MF-1]|uniref:Retrotransposon gag domain-containing protein n=1 Tax=Austropuccinia psidii MF-1 TaxID=1389203 RepID=A0A9Q3KME2_9BASI|nr:hypothetical protein [Austropuccinia psidii MF-1]
MKAPDSFDGTKAYKLRGFIQSCQLIFHNDPPNFFSERKKVLYSNSFPTGRAGKGIEPYLSNISNEDPSYLLNNWKLFETQLFTLIGVPIEVRKAEQGLDNLRMKESGQVSFYIADFRSLKSIIGYWGERAYIHVYRRGLESRLLDQLASHPGNFDILQELMDITLELDTRYHQMQKEKGSNQEKSLQSVDTTSPNLLKVHRQRRLITGRIRRGRIFKCPKTSLMLLSSLRTTN